ncbi:hypothetical protein D9M68_760680 [compost metagenome]
MYLHPRFIGREDLQYIIDRNGIENSLQVMVSVRSFFGDKQAYVDLGIRETEHKKSLGYKHKFIHKFEILNQKTWHSEYIPKPAIKGPLVLSVVREWAKTVSG